ncbi:hypothetical protein [Thermotalea metallivorans]|uniref:hypothetical protein n=1 Tax=Thermotalea metallivorans TaxID=520762 RepID=UPI0018DBDC37|nr:hypothetical protein [Thermotalea metallivorans]
MAVRQVFFLHRTLVRIPEKKIYDGAVDLKNSMEKNIEETKSSIERGLKDKKEEIREVVGKIRNLRKTAKEDAAACTEITPEEAKTASKEKSE